MVTSRYFFAPRLPDSTKASFPSNGIGQQQQRIPHELGPASPARPKYDSDRSDSVLEVVAYQAQDSQQTLDDNRPQRPAFWVACDPLQHRQATSTPKPHAHVPYALWRFSAHVQRAHQLFLDDPKVNGLRSAKPYSAIRRLACLQMRNLQRRAPERTSLHQRGQHSYRQSPTGTKQTECKQGY